MSEETPPNSTPTDVEAASSVAQSEVPEVGAAITIAEAAGARSPEEIERITANIIAAFKTVYDPEIPVDIYELGLIYRVDLDDDANLDIDMTLTAPGCPVAGELPVWVENAARTVEGIQDVNVNMVFDPPWTADRMSEEAQVALNWW